MAATSRTAPATSRPADELIRARRRTEEVLAPLSDDELCAQVSPLQSPLVWDYAHVAYFEELWLLRRTGGAEPLDDRFDDLYDAFAHARGERSSLPILSPARARAYAAEVRARSLDLLDRLPSDEDDPLLAGGFVVGLVVQHELQHVETMLQTLGLRDRPYEGAPAERPLDGDRRSLALDAGTFTMGAVDAPWAYDNELPAHAVDVGAFAIDSLPVSNEDWATFVEDGGYEERSLWTEEGWDWRRREGASAPLGWEQADGGGRRRRRFGISAPLVGTAAVQNVSWWEADAYARWAGGRLPTEEEWERAAPLLAGVGNVWEWTSSRFLPYPGFEAFPYREYSEVFFGGDYRVLRGGSWATDPLVARTTFRNWDHPQRRQIFSGLRVARDA